jgi:tetratricopeptide (TPR) repeat protein
MNTYVSSSLPKVIFFLPAIICLANQGKACLPQGVQNAVWYDSNANKLSSSGQGETLISKTHRDKPPAKQKRQELLQGAEAEIICGNECHDEKQLEHYLNAFRKYQEVQSENSTETDPELDIQMASLLDDIIIIYCILNNPEEKLTFLLHALPIYKRIYGEKHRTTAFLLSRVGEAYKECGRYKEQLEFHISALHMYEEIDEDEGFAEKSRRLSIAPILNDMGYAYAQLENFEQSLEHYQRALRIYETIEDQNPDTLALLLYDLGHIYGQIENYAQQLSLSLRALDLYESFYGKDHPISIPTLSKVSLAYIKLGGFDQALPYCLRAFTLCKKVYGKSSRELIPILDNLRMFFSLGDQSKRKLTARECALTISQGDSTPNAAP